MFTGLKIRTKFLFCSSLVILSCLGLICGFMVYTLRQNMDRDITGFRATETEKVRQMLRNYVDIAYETIDSAYKNALDRDYLEKMYGKKLKSIVDIAQKQIEDLITAAEKGEITEDEAKAQAMAGVKKLRYDNGTGYLWINDTGKPIPRMIMHPTVPDLDGKVLDNPKFNCALGKGENLFSAFAEVVEKSGEGFVDYLWPKPVQNGLTEDQPKLSYVRLVKKWNWIIGTGIYVDDAKADAIEKIKQDIKKMRYDKGAGYFWINDTSEPHPIMIMHPTVPSLDGKALNDPKFNCAEPDGKNLFVTFREVTLAQGDGYVRYLWPKPTQDGLTEKQPKESYVRLYKPLNWIIGTGVYVDDIDAVVAGKTANLEREIRSLLARITLIALGVCIVGFAGLWLVTRHLTRPMANFVLFTEELGKGNLTAEVAIESSDEIGMLAASLKDMGKNLRTTMNTIHSVTMKISRGAEEQAASIEEVSASLTELSASTRTNADNAATGERVLHETTQGMSAADETMRKVNLSMQEISQSSEAIKKIIKSIDEIAFQTNLLALNAAVEAARAGETGAGFAVVADEVRSLAKRAADAARETEVLIDATVTKIQGSVATAHSATANFQAVRNNMTEVHHLVQDISKASLEQSHGIEQINEMISIINTVTQQNAYDVQNLVDEVNRFAVDG